MLDKLQQIEATPTVSRYFAKLYYKAIKNTNRYAEHRSEQVRQFVFGFETSFGAYFSNAHSNYLSGKKVTGSWQDYYQSDTLNELQYQFMGMNAHINGDMHKGLIDTYTYDTLKKYKHELLRFQKSLNIFYDSVYASTFIYPRLRKIHRLTLGLDRLAGRKMVLHWRRRQIHMALLYYRHPVRYARRFIRLQQLIHRWDRRIIDLFK